MKATSLGQELREDLFVSEYLVDLNVSAACRRLHVNECVGRALMRKDSVRAAIREEVDRRKAFREIDVAAILDELACIAFANAKDYDPILDGVHITDLLSDSQAKAIASITRVVTPQGHQQFAYKLYDKMRALELLGKYKALWTEVSQMQGPGGSSVVLEIKPIGQPVETKKDL